MRVFIDFESEIKSCDEKVRGDKRRIQIEKHIIESNSKQRLNRQNESFLVEILFFFLYYTAPKKIYFIFVFFTFIHDTIAKRYKH